MRARLHGGYDSFANLGSRFVWTGHVKRLALIAKLKHCVAGIGIDVAKQLFHHSKIRMRIEPGRLRPSGHIAEQFAGCRRIDRPSGTDIIQFAGEGLNLLGTEHAESDILDAKAEGIDQKHANAARAA